MKTHIHDLSLFVTFLEGYISGVEDYVARALLSPEGAVVFDDYDVGDYVEYLRSMNVGPKKVWTVESTGDTLFHALGQSDQLNEILEESDVVVPFVSWEYTNKFKDKWGLKDDQWKTQPPEIHQKLENKTHLREIGKEEWFTDYITCRDKKLVEIGQEMLKEYENILVRHPKKASGVGAKQIKDPEYFQTQDFDQFVYEHSDDNHFLVEEFFDKGQEFSIIWDVDAEGEPELQFWTRQYIHDCVHQGNLVADVEGVFPWEATETIREIKEATRSIIEEYPYFGRIGFDLKVSPSGEWNILECNCRYGGSTYPGFTREQVGDDRCVLMHNIHPEMDNFKQVHQAFADSGVDYSKEDRKGAFVGNPFCLPDKCAAMIVAESPNEAEQFLSTILDEVDK